MDGFLSHKLKLNIQINNFPISRSRNNHLTSSLYHHAYIHTYDPGIYLTKQEEQQW